MTTEKKIVITSVVFGIVIALLIGAVFFPLLKSVKKDLNNLISIKRDLIFFSGDVEISRQLRSKYKKIEADLDKMDKLFVDRQAPIDLIEFWEKTAADYGLSITISAYPLRKKNTDPWDSIGFQINLTGSFPGFLRFLEKIESSSYLIEAKSLTINKLEKNKDGEEEEFEIIDGDIKANLLVKVFVK